MATSKDKLSNKNSNKKDAPETAADVKKVMQSKGFDGKSVWSTTLETFGMADGTSSKKNDIICTTEQEAMTAIQGMVDAETDDKFKFSLTPLAPLGATMEEFLRAFVMWSKKDQGAPADDETTNSTTFNVTKAFERLAVYATFMEDNRKDLEDPLLVDSSLRNARDCWGSKATIDAKGRVVWWFDVGAFDLAGIKKGVPLKDSLRYLVWQSHTIFLNKHAQDNGLVLVQAMGNRGLLETMTMVPRELGTKLDRMMIGVLPVKIKKIYLFNTARWVGFLSAMMAPFMSKKMKQRMVSIPNKKDPQPIFDEEVGRECIPSNFSTLKGDAKADKSDLATVYLN